MDLAKVSAGDSIIVSSSAPPDDLKLALFMLELEYTKARSNRAEALDALAFPATPEDISGSGVSWRYLNKSPVCILPCAVFLDGICSVATEEPELRLTEPDENGSHSGRDAVLWQFEVHGVK